MLHVQTIKIKLTMARLYHFKQQRQIKLHWPHPGTASEGNPEIRTTFSEKVQELNYVNDPWEESGIGPTRWSLPFYGGHIVRTPEVLRRSPSTLVGPHVLPVFGGPPCTDVGGKTPTVPAPDESATSESPRRRWQEELPSALCYLLFPMLHWEYVSWTTRL